MDAKAHADWVAEIRLEAGQEERERILARIQTLPRAFKEQKWYRVDLVHAAILGE